jgi:hypothetical protein
MAINVLYTAGGLLSTDKDREWKAEDNDAAGARRVSWFLDHGGVGVDFIYTL